MTRGKPRDDEGQALNDEKQIQDDEIRQERRAEARLPFPPNKYFYCVLNAYFLMQRTAAEVFGA